MRITDLEKIQQEWRDIPEPLDYTLSDLKKAVKLPWQKFAEWAEKLASKIAPDQEKQTDP